MLRFDSNYAESGGGGGARGGLTGSTDRSQAPLEVALWLHATFGLTTENVHAKTVNNAWQTARARGHLHVAQWLHNTFELT